MEGSNDFIIRIQSLRNGEQTCEYSIKEDFFRDFDNTQILDADIKAIISIQKESGWMKIGCKIKGTVVTECDRCLDNLELPVDFSADMAVKFAKKANLGDDMQESEEFMIIDPTEGEVDLKQFIYDYICINLPLQKVHKEGECNKEMIAKLRGSESAEVNSQFGNLKQMLEKKEISK